MITFITFPAYLKNKSRFKIFGINIPSDHNFLIFFIRDLVEMILGFETVVESEKYFHYFLRREGYLRS